MFKKKKFTPEEKQKRKVERFKAQNINPYPVKKITEGVVWHGSQHLIKSRKASLPSSPERQIARYLDEIKVKYVREKFFKDLYSRITGKLLFFDFYLPEFKAVIEYDGHHHFSGSASGNQRFNDSTKDEYCKWKGFPMLRVSYKQHKDLIELTEQFIRAIEVLRI